MSDTVQSPEGRGINDRVNNWRVLPDRSLKLVSSYANFREDLDQALSDLERQNPISKPLCETIGSDISRGVLAASTYLQFSKWCDWNQERAMAIARTISRILFGFEMPRMYDQQNRVIDQKLISDFLDKVQISSGQNEFKPSPATKSSNPENKGYSMSQDEISKKYKEYEKAGIIRFVTFHPSYCYEEFIEGITVELREQAEAKSEISYRLKPGIFKEMCRKALAAAFNSTETDRLTWKEVFEQYEEHPEEYDFTSAQKYVLIIDEINRGDIAKIFGELITLIECDKRLGETNEMVVTLPASGDRFGVPSNLYIIGTMNTADRSIALLDVALRRRFGFSEMNPDFEILRREHLVKNEATLAANGVKDLLEMSILAIEKINQKLCREESIGRDKQIGHSFLFKVDTVEDLCLVWQNEIFPLLQEYYYGNYKRINDILFGFDGDTQWMSTQKGIGLIDGTNILGLLNKITAAEDAGTV